MFYDLIEIWILILMSHKVHIFWEGHKILQNLHLTFDWHYIGFVVFSEYMKFKIDFYHLQFLALNGGKNPQKQLAFFHLHLKLLAYCSLRNSEYKRAKKVGCSWGLIAPPEPPSSDRPGGYNVRQLKICTHIYNHKTFGLVRHYIWVHTEYCINSTESNLVFYFKGTFWSSQNCSLMQNCSLFIR